MSPAIERLKHIGDQRTIDRAVPDVDPSNRSVLVHDHRRGQSDIRSNVLDPIGAHHIQSGIRQQRNRGAHAFCKRCIGGDIVD